jgi:hypothetical protein
MGIIPLEIYIIPPAGGVMPAERGVSPLARGMLHAEMVVMRAAGGETCAGIGVMHAARAVSRLPGDATAVPSGVSRLVRGAGCRLAGVAPDPGSLTQNPARVTPLPSWVVPSPILLHRFSFGAERFEQELQLGGVPIVQLRISRERGVAVASEDSLESFNQDFER